MFLLKLLTSMSSMAEIRHLSFLWKILISMGRLCNSTAIWTNWRFYFVCRFCLFMRMEVLTEETHTSPSICCLLCVPVLNDASLKAQHLALSMTVNVAEFKIFFQLRTHGANKDVKLYICCIYVWWSQPYVAVVKWILPPAISKRCYICIPLQKLD